jgi:amidase
MTDIHELTATEQGAAIAAGELSSAEVVRHYADRIERLDPRVGAYITVTTEAALAQAAESDRRSAVARRDGEPLGPLHGVPIVVKDNVAVDGVRCTYGSAAFADHVADLDDHVVTRFREAGMPLLGKSNTPEFALPCHAENLIGPPTRNPWDLTRSPGGSSGGSAAAVSAGLAALGHGTDSGGSVRIPAAACGVIGVKPSRGRVSNGPVGHDVTGLTSQGVLARSCPDARALLDVMAGLMPGDVYLGPGDLGSGDLGSEPRRRPLRVAVAALPLVPDVPVHPACAGALAGTARRLAELGHEVEDLELSPDQGVADAFGMVWSVVAARMPLGDGEEGDLTPFTRLLRERGRAVGGVELHEALALFRGIGQMLADLVFSSFDVLLTPTTAHSAAPIGEFTGDFAGGDPVKSFDRMQQFMPFTPLHNITGLPSVSIPAGLDEDGLPVGVLLGGRYGHDDALLDLADELLAGPVPVRDLAGPVR